MIEYKTSERQRVAVAEHYRKNREAKLAYARKYHQEHAAELQAYRDKHRGEKKAYNDAYLIANRETLKDKSTRYFDEHPGYKAVAYKRWADANKSNNRARKRKYDKEKRQSDPLYRLRCNLRARIHQALKSKKPPSARTMKSTGCTVQFLKGWLESRFQAGMSWENYGSRGWHVDHIIPCDAFDLCDPEQQKQCFHYTNLQPLWAPDNLKKSNFVEETVRNCNTNIRGRGEREANPESTFPRAANKQEPKA